MRVSTSSAQQHEHEEGDVDVGARAEVEHRDAAEDDHGGEHAGGGVEPFAPEREDDPAEQRERDVGEPDDGQRGDLAVQAGVRPRAQRR